MSAPTPGGRPVLLTGAAGGVGHILRAGLPELGWTLRLHDIAEITDAAPGQEVRQGDVADRAGMRAAMEGVSAVVHLGGIPVEAPFDDILHSNLDGIYTTFEAARLAGVRRIVFASSNHAVGFAPRPADPSANPLPAEIPTRPDTYYGVSKVFGEALGSLYVDRYGLEVVALRIGSCLPEPTTTRHLSTWLSPADCVRLTHAALTAEAPGFTAVYGISANTRGWWDLSAGRAIGFDPVDDSEVYAAAIIAEQGEIDPASLEHRTAGGEFCGPENDVDEVLRRWGRA